MAPDEIKIIKFYFVIFRVQILVQDWSTSDQWIFRKPLFEMSVMLTKDLHTYE